MSLNGLDDQPVVDAFQAALAEAGGWFLLKYASRDAVEILQAGTGASGGVSELRKAVAQYQDKSPLYGFLLYRRRNVLLKYVPEGTSRLLQARVTVHFTEIEEKFSPHDSVFSFASPEELSDNALAAANSLHTAAPPSPSAEKKKLDGIHEDAEKTPGSGEATTIAVTDADAGSTVNAEGASSPRASEDQRPKSPGGTGQNSLDYVLGSPKGYATSVHSLNQYDPLYQDEHQRRFSTQTARPGGADLYDFSYLYKPKVKLGPRPTTERPPSAADGNGKSAKLPASLKAAVRKTTPTRPKSRDTSTVPSIGVPPPPATMPPVPDIHATAAARPTSSSGPQSSSASTKSNGITPEKQRLMKALELRKKQMAAKAAKEKKKAPDKLEVPTADDATSGASEAQASEEDGAADADAEDWATQQTSASTDSGRTLKAEAPATPDHTKADSGVLMSESGDGDEDDARAPTPVASSPISIQESLNPSSTRPSSISEAGDQKDRLNTEQKAEILVTNSNAETSSGSVAADLNRVCEAEQPVAAVSSPDRGATGVHQTTAAKAPEPVRDNKTASPTLEDAASVPLPQRRSLSTDKRRSYNSVKRRSYNSVKRRSHNSVIIDVTGDASDSDYLSDDSFMEELQSATVEEAKPMSVSKSPIMPIFPRRKSTNSDSSSGREAQRTDPSPAAPPNDQENLAPDEVPESSLAPAPAPSAPEPYRAVSNPVVPGTQETITPEEQPRERMSRSMSASHASSPQDKEVPLAKKVGVSTGIAGRIAALAEKSNRESVHMVPRPNDSSNFLVAKRQSSFRGRSPPESRPTSKQSMHSKRLSQSSFHNPTPKFLAKQHTGNSNDNLHTVYNKSSSSRPESVTVTARIIRTPGPEPSELSTPIDQQPTMDFQQSDITIDHIKPQSPEPSAQSPASQLSPAQPAPAPKSPEEQAPESSWHSFNRRRSEIGMSPPPAVARSQSITSIESTESKSDEKKGSKASRFLKRMSNSFSPNKKPSTQTLSPTVQEETIEEAPADKPAAQPMEIGDLNVQFPDTLLWKRRWVEVDDGGNLVLSPPLQAKGITKRYHLSEFLAPIIPDHERQEMPNSVILDFSDGRTLQCACEDSARQAHVLELMRKAWTAHKN